MIRSRKWANYSKLSCGVNSFSSLSPFFLVLSSLSINLSLLPLNNLLFVNLSVSFQPFSLKYLFSLFLISLFVHQCIPLSFLSIRSVSLSISYIFPSAVKWQVNPIAMTASLDYPLIYEWSKEVGCRNQHIIRQSMESYNKKDKNYISVPL